MLTGPVSCGVVSCSVATAPANSRFSSVITRPSMKRLQDAGANGQGTLNLRHPVLCGGRREPDSRRQTISRNVRGNDAPCTNRGVMADTDTRQDAHAGADPHVIFDNNRFGWRQQAMLLKVVLVVIEDEGVVAQKAVTPNRDQFVR